MTFESFGLVSVERILDECLGAANFRIGALRQLAKIDLAERMERIGECRMFQCAEHEFIRATELNARALRQIHSQDKNLVLHIQTLVTRPL